LWETLQYEGIGNSFVNRTPIARKQHREMSNRIASSSKGSAQQRKQSKECRDILQNGRQSLPTIHLIRDLNPEYTNNSN
jgi:hypothetical protein